MKALKERHCLRPPACFLPLCQQAPSIQLASGLANVALSRGGLCSRRGGGGGACERSCPMAATRESSFLLMSSVGRSWVTLWTGFFQACWRVLLPILSRMFDMVILVPRELAIQVIHNRLSGLKLLCCPSRPSGRLQAAWTSTLSTARRRTSCAHVYS